VTGQRVDVRRESTPQGQVEVDSRSSGRVRRLRHVRACLRPGRKVERVDWQAGEGGEELLGVWERDAVRSLQPRHLMPIGEPARR
jgi:hypothetical protein